MKQPYIYTMPEGFMQDQSVPMKWRLYGFINGFWIAGKQVYASSPYLAEKLGCTTRHIRRCLEELEKDGYVRRLIQGKERLIMPNTLVIEEDAGSPSRTPEVLSVGHGASYQADAGGPHISDSISERQNTSVADAPRVVEVREDREENPSRTPRAKYPNAKAVFRLFGEYPPLWERNTTMLAAAEGLYASYGLEELAGQKAWHAKNRKRDFCPQFDDPNEWARKYEAISRFFDKINS